MFTTDAPWQLHPRVALRPEPFGALAYHYDNRRLNFLRSHDLVSLVECLGVHASAEEAFESCGIVSSRRPAFAQALSSLARSDFLVPQLEDTAASLTTTTSEK